MRERVHGHIGIDVSVPGEQGAGRAVRPPRRRAPGPRPVRPYVPQAASRRDGTPAVRRPADPAADRGGATTLGAVGGGPHAQQQPHRAPALGDDAGRGCGSVAGRRPVRSSAAPRLLVSRPGRPATSRGDRVRRLLAGLALVLVAAAVVVGLGRIADAAAQSRAAEAPAVTHVGEVGVGQVAVGQVTVGQVTVGQVTVGQVTVGQVSVGEVGVGEVTVTVTAPGTVWDVADRVAPGASGPERAALVDRIVAANALTSVRVAPGTVLRVPV